MIQRIQTIFLLLAAASGFGVLATPFATTSTTVQDSVLFADAIYNVQDNAGLLVMFALAGALSLASVFLFKNRQTQMKICRLAIIANILGFVLAIFIFWRDLAAIHAVTPSDGMGAYLPLAFLVFGILALRFIRKDEETVKSMDRLR